MPDDSQHPYVRELRRNQTPAERKFFKLLHQCLLDNFPDLYGGVGKQVLLRHDKGFYILDFYIGKIKLAFEIDGKYHWGDKQLDKDLKRDTFLENSKNIMMVHISNNRVLNKKKKKLLKEELIQLIDARKKQDRRGMWNG